MALLEIDGLNLAIGAREILHELSLAVERGESLGLVGESGSGKSMTAAAIMQLLPPGTRQSGALRFRGYDMMTMSDAQLRPLRGQHIGMIFQEPMTALNPLMTIGNQVAETVRAHRRISGREAARIARAALDRVGLDAAHFSLRRYPHELSGGQRQRVAIAIATSLAPQLLIADEPTTALDVTTQAQILDLLAQMACDSGMALILITHDLAVAARATDRLAILQGGRLVEHGSTKEILRVSREPYTRSLIAAAEHRRFPPAAPQTSHSFAPARRTATVPSALAATVSPASPTGAVEAPILEVRNVVCEYTQASASFFKPARRFRAVDGVSLTIQRGERVGLVGESGSGKSTLLRSILAVERVESGEVRIDGEPFATGARALRRRIQCVFQDPVSSFDPRWRVERLIAEPLHLLASPPSAIERRRKVEMLLGQVGLLANDADRFPHEFSGGQRQRIAIARALIVEPDIVVLDEAVSALDATTRVQILTLLAELSKTRGLAFLFVSHDLGVVRQITDRVYVLHRGRVVESGSTLDVFAAPRDPYTASLIAATPRL